MPDEQGQQSPEILKAIQAAERKVERMLRTANQEASAILEKARAEAEALLAEKRRSLAKREQEVVAQTIMEAEREAEHLVLQARVKANDLKAQCLARLDEAAELVLRRVLPAERR